MDLILKHAEDARALLIAPQIRTGLKLGMSFKSETNPRELYELLLSQIPLLLNDSISSALCQFGHIQDTPHKQETPQRVLALKMEARRYNAIIRMCHDNLTQLLILET